MGIVQSFEFNSAVAKATPLEVIELALHEVDRIERESESPGGIKWSFSQYRKGWIAGKDCIPPRRVGQSHRDYANDLAAQALRMGEQYPHDVIKSMIVLALFRLTPEMAAKYKQQSHDAIVRDMKRETRRAILNVDKYIAIGRALLDGNSYLDRILGLCALTGRRSREIGCTAVFDYVDDNHVGFVGQLKTKTRGDINRFVIPVLTDAKQIIKTLTTIRQDKPELVDDPELFHNRCSKDLHTRARKHFSLIYSDGQAKPKDLRPSYAEICWLLFDDRRTGKPLYFSQLLGHGDDDIVTAQSYDDFEIDDPEFN